MMVVSSSKKAGSLLCKKAWFTSYQREDLIREQEEMEREGEGGEQELGDACSEGERGG